MQRDSVAPKTCTPSPGKAAARRRRLRRGVDLWNLDRRLCAERTQRAILLTFTVTGNWQEEAQGRMRDFWNDVRNTWLGTRYFCWAELTARGQLHYHAWWINPPHMKRVNLIAWVKRHWGSDRTQISFPHARITDESLADYVKKYVFKMGAKRYQQQYEVIPSSFRTFMTQRLEIPPKELKEHLDRDDWQYQQAHVERLEDRSGGTSWVDEHLVLVGRITHEVPPGGRCSALDHQRPRPHPKWHRPPGAAPPLKTLGYTHSSPTSAAARRAHD